MALSLSVLGVLVIALVARASLAPIPLELNGQTYTSKETLQSRDGKMIYAYYGIPYARQPVGRFRFTRPEPMANIDRWGLNPDERKVYEQRSARRSCPQVDPITGTFDEQNSEDCLRVDIYITEAVSGDASRKTGMAVLIDGFDFKASIGHRVNPRESFLNGQSKVGVLAVVHSRLGALGYLTTEDDAAPANLGLWDQHEALAFLSNNADKLRVDPKLITVLGFGSGGIATSLHMINGKNTDLFQTAVVSGGSALSPDANIRYAYDRAMRFGEEFGCTSSNTGKFVGCMRGADLRKLVETGDRFLWGPVIDRNHTGDDSKRYIRDYPETLMKQETFDSMRAVIYGYPEKAGSYRYYSAKMDRIDIQPMSAIAHKPVKNSSVKPMSAANIPTTVDDVLYKYLSPYQIYADTAKTIVASAKFVYFRNYTDQELLQNQTLTEEIMTQVLTDYLAFAPMATAADMHAKSRLAKHPTTGVYVYMRKAEQYMPTFAAGVKVMNGARINQATAMDDLLQFVWVDGLPSYTPGTTQRSDTNLVTQWASAFSNTFGTPGTPSNPIPGLDEYYPPSVDSRSHIPSPTYYIAVLRNLGTDRNEKVRLRRPGRVFWSEYVPYLQETLDSISETSQDRHEKAKVFRGVTIGTGIAVGVLLIIIIVLSVLLWRSRRSNNANMPNVAFRKVAQNDP